MITAEHVLYESQNKLRCTALIFLEKTQEIQTLRSHNKFCKISIRSTYNAFHIIAQLHNNPLASSATVTMPASSHPFSDFGKISRGQLNKNINHGLDHNSSSVNRAAGTYQKVVRPKTASRGTEVQMPNLGVDWRKIGRGS